MKFISGIIALLGAAIASCSHAGRDYSAMEQELQEYVASKDAAIGVAVIIDGKDTVAVNGNEWFPMLSVFKFPQALAVADYCQRCGMELSDTIDISRNEIRENTWSPMRDRFGVGDLRLPIDTLLAYSIKESDNNACDILFRLTGGPASVEQYLDSIGVDGIAVRYTEDDMHRDLSTCYHNGATPLAMARLLDRFDNSMRCENEAMEQIAAMMESCLTGVDRLKAALPDSGVVIGHKTGTGDRNHKGEIIGINDIGYIHLSGKHRYSIAVFVSDSPYTPDETSAIIAEVSRIAMCHIAGLPSK